MARRWTREELIELARGHYVGARDLRALEVPPPAWLVEPSLGLWPYDSAASVAQTHTDDREALIQAFVDCSSRPAEQVTVRTRGRSFGYWHHSQTTWLNLVDQDDVGLLLFFTRPVDGPPIDIPEDERVGEHAPTKWMLWTLSPTGDILAAEGASLELLGYEPHELVGMASRVFLPPETVAEGLAMWLNLVAEPGATATNRRIWARRDGSRIWLDDAFLMRRDENGKSSVLMVAWDASVRRAQEAALRDQQAQLVAREAEKSALAAQMQALANDFQVLADEVPAAVFRCDAAGTVQFHNARWAELVGDRDGVTRLHDIVHPADHLALNCALSEVVNAGTSLRRSIEVAGDARDRFWRVSLRGAGDRDGDRGDHLVGSIEDVSVTVRLRQEAHHDGLTGVLNRTGLDALLADALSVDPTDLLVVFVDLDRFKEVNDTWGHDVGDVVLAGIGQRLATAVRPDDLVSRYGGDEFVIVYRAAATTDPEAVTSRLATALADPVPFPGGAWSPAASMGWTRGRPGDDAASIIRRADLAMFDRKRVRRTDRTG
jgi:diguanylate cyclase (GGDEF)-like protein/PAS domain S-box-containing protein